MALVPSKPPPQNIIASAFNQDHTHLAVGTRHGWRIFACDPFGSPYSSSESGVSAIQMLYSSALVALVGAGERAGESPRRLRLWNTHTDTDVGCDLCFPTAILGVRMNRQRLVVVLESALHIFELMSMHHLHTLPTAPNPRGLAALSGGPESCHCATLTADGKDGHVRARLGEHAWARMLGVWRGSGCK
jgi:autophagy-related protein 18